jgi:Uncharacterized protein conserved in bacteria
MKIKLNDLKKNFKNFFDKENISLKFSLLKNKLSISYFKYKEFLIKLKETIHQFFKTLNWKIFIATLLTIITVTLILANLTFLIWVKKYNYVKVPSLKGKFIVEAILELQKYDLYPKIESIYSSDSYGLVLNQTPEAGKMIKNKRYVRLLVSLGPFVKTLEDFSGKSQYYVEKKLLEISSFIKKEIKIKEILYQYSDIIPPGYVISQEPQAGTDLLLVDNITLIISKGPLVGEIIVPSFKGLNENEAIEKAKENGILLKIEYLDTEKPEEFEIVLSQSINEW